MFDKIKNGKWRPLTIELQKEERKEETNASFFALIPYNNSWNYFKLRKVEEKSWALKWVSRC